jgi:hypothetical protein
MQAAARELELAVRRHLGILEGLQQGVRGQRELHALVRCQRVAAERGAVHLGAHATLDCQQRSAAQQGTAQCIWEHMHGLLAQHRGRAARDACGQAICWQSCTHLRVA